MCKTFAYVPGSSDWMGSWTLFFWAFWLAWGPFVGVFLARISRGRTLREFVIAAITVPVLCDFIIVSFFGNSAFYEVLQGNTAFAELAVQSPERGWYALLELFPGATILIALATLSGLLFYITSANSGAMVMFSFSKALKIERAEREGTVLRRPSVTPSGGHIPERSWKQRLGQMLAYPSKRETEQFLERVVRPALNDVANEFERQGHKIDRDNIPHIAGDIDVGGPLLKVSTDAQNDFYYQVSMVETPSPTFSGKMSPVSDVYYRLEVTTQTGSGGYDLMGLTKQQVIDDVLEQYEAYLTFITSPPETEVNTATAAVGVTGKS